MLVHDGSLLVIKSLPNADGSYHRQWDLDAGEEWLVFHDVVHGNCWESMTNKLVKPRRSRRYEPVMDLMTSVTAPQLIHHAGRQLRQCGQLPGHCGEGDAGVKPCR